MLLHYAIISMKEPISFQDFWAKLGEKMNYVAHVGCCWTNFIYHFWLILGTSLLNKWF